MVNNMVYMVNNTHSFSLVKDTGPNTAMVAYMAYYVLCYVRCQSYRNHWT